MKIVQYHELPKAATSSGSTGFEENVQKNFILICKALEMEKNPNVLQLVDAHPDHLIQRFFLLYEYADGTLLLRFV